MNRIAAAARDVWRRIASGKVQDFYNHVLIIVFNVQQVWLYFEFPGRLSLFAAFMGAWSIVFAWKLTSRPSHLAAIGAFLISASAIVMVIFCYASLYEHFGVLSTPDEHITHDPTICLYFSMVTITTLGYGDFVPSPSARLVAGSEALAGLFLIAALIAVFARIFNRLAGSDATTTPGA